MTPLKRLARIAGFFYLIVGILRGFAEGFVGPKMYVAGNAAATASNVVANAGLLRLGVVADLLDGDLLRFTALALYILLKDVHKSAGQGDARVRPARCSDHLHERGLRIRRTCASRPAG